MSEMTFCDDCGSMLPAGGGAGTYPDCGAEYEKPQTDGLRADDETIQTS